MEKKEYLLDRTSLKGMTFEEADDHVSYWVNKTELERLNAACFIINQIFDVTPTTKIDFSVTDKRKQP
jgi:translation initiation factor 2B subunit (eIF-2B alpha/beta/delta family)